MEESLDDCLRKVLRKVSADSGSWVNLPAERQFIYLADLKAAREGARYLAAQRADAVKVWFIGGGQRPFEEIAAAVRAAGEEAAAAQMRLIVHATELRLAKEALRAGAKLLVHSVWDEASDDEFLTLARKNEAILLPDPDRARGVRAPLRRRPFGNRTGGGRSERLRGRRDACEHRRHPDPGQGARRSAGIRKAGRGAGPERSGGSGQPPGAGPPPPPSRAG